MSNSGKAVTTTVLALILAAFNAYAVNSHASSNETSAQNKNHQDAANIFVERCSLCHGNDAMGEGLIPLKVKDYPPTNIYHSRQFVSQKQLINLINNGLPGEDLKHYMPPWKGEISKQDIAKLADFIIFFRTDLDNANAMLLAATKRGVFDSRRMTQHGAAIFATRCVLCHGSKGLGDGRMSRIIKSPPPANLQASTVPLDYIKLIVSRGGDAVKRSPQMPPWSDQLTEMEIDAVSQFVLDLRQHQPGKKQ